MVTPTFTLPADDWYLFDSAPAGDTGLSSRATALAVRALGDYRALGPAPSSLSDLGNPAFLGQKSDSNRSYVGVYRCNLVEFD